MPTSLTRIVGGLDEQSQIPLKELIPFSTRRFEVRFEGGQWTLTPSTPPTGLMAAFDPLVFNGIEISEPHRLSDDDMFTAGNDHWVFHAGEVAREPRFEEAALNCEASDPAWQVLADWLLEKGDPLGARIAAHRGKRTPRRILAPHVDRDVYVGLRGGDDLITIDEISRIEVEEQNGVVSRLIARSVTGIENEFAAALHLRRTRLLKHLVLDAPPERVESWIEALDRWALPSSLETISFGAPYGPTPPEWTEPRLPPRLLHKCPKLQSQPLIRWAATARLEVAQNAGAFQLKGIEPGEALRVTSGTVIELHASEIHFRVGPSYPGIERYYSFELHGLRWHLVASDRSVASTEWHKSPKPLAASIAGWRVRRTPLLHGDLIELEPGLSLRFRLET